MIDEHELPDDLAERASMLEGLMIARATGEPNASNQVYATLRREFMERPDTKALLPKFVRVHRSLDAFWPWIQEEAGDERGMWARRRAIISQGFNELIGYLEGANRAPADDGISQVLESFDADGVHAAWMKALDRRADDPEGAITMARTLLETVCKRILEEANIEYTNKEDLQKLFRMASSELNLSPDQHVEEAFKRILGGCQSVVTGLGTLRNRVGDAHGKGKKSVRPAARHAHLAVNLAGSMATFLVETWLARKNIEPD